MDKLIGSRAMAKLLELTTATVMKMHKLGVFKTEYSKIGGRSGELPLWVASRAEEYRQAYEKYKSRIDDARLNRL
jgi:hypothetical protein